MRDEIRLLPSAESAALATVAMWRVGMDAIPGGWIDEREGAAAVFTGDRFGAFNGVLTTSREVATGVVTELLDRVAATGAPYTLHLREGATSSIEQIARDRGMVLDSKEPVMILRDLPSLKRAARTDARIRQLHPHEGRVHARLMAAVFAGIEVTEAEVAPSDVSAPGSRCYVAEVAGEAVATATGWEHAGSLAVLAVATLPQHRRRGYGSALIAHTVFHGLAAGSEWAWLQTSVEGAGFYEELGFRTFETEAIWKIA